MNKYASLSNSDIEKEIKELNGILRNRANDIKLQEEEAKKEWYANNIEGNLYYGDTPSSHGFDRIVQLVRPIYCDDWSIYNSCIAIVIKIFYFEGIVKEIRYHKNEKFRIDILGTHLVKCKKEMYDKFYATQMIEYAEIIESLNIFHDGK